MVIYAEIKKQDKCTGEDGLSVFLSFEYNVDVLNVVRALPQRQWHANDKQWEVPLKTLPKLLDSIDWAEWHIHSDEYVELITEENVETPSEFEFKTKPFSHQIDGFNYGLVHDRWLLGDEQGLGKTKQAIDIAVAKKYQKGYKHCLIICGVNGLKWNWYNEVSTHSNEQAYILGQNVKRNKITIGSNADKLADLRKLDINSCYFIITNVESLRNKDIAEEIHTLCENGEIGITVIDEVHKCKDPNSQQGKGILKVNSECRIAMTGTPLMNSPMDIYIILKWLGYESHSFYTFKNHYCVMGGYGGYEVIGYKNMEQLESQLHEIMLRRKKEDVLDLPEKTYINEYVEMSKEQKTIYDQVTEEVRDNIDQIAVSPNPLAQLIRLRQATGYTGILSSTIKQSAKLDRMEELVDEAVNNGQKVVIFSNWTQMTDVVYNRLQNKYKVGVITGETADNYRQTLVDAYQGGKLDIMIGTLGAMGTGITLTAGTVEIFLDEPWNRALKDQAEDRCHRIGQNSNVTIYTLLTKNTIDERVHDLIVEKGEMSDALVDGKTTTNKRDLLDYLLS